MTEDQQTILMIKGAIAELPPEKKAPTTIEQAQRIAQLAYEHLELPWGTVEKLAQDYIDLKRKEESDAAIRLSYGRVRDDSQGDAQELPYKAIETAYREICNAIFKAHGKALPENWVYTDSETTLDLLVAEITCTRAERDSLREQLARSYRERDDSINKLSEQLVQARQDMDLGKYLERQEEWSARTFGRSLRTKGIVEHIRKELLEILEQPHDLTEWIDVMILALDGFWRHGGRPSEVMSYLQAKQDKNFARQWPYPPPPDDQASEHIDAARKEDHGKL